MQDTVIYWNIKGELRLTLQQYVVADIIRQHSKNGAWCDLSRSFIASIAGMSERGVFNILSELKERGFCEDKKDKKYGSGEIRTTDDYNKCFPIEDRGEAAPQVTKEITMDVDKSPFGPRGETAFKEAMRGGEEAEVIVSDEEASRRKIAVQPMVSEINRYAEKLGKNPIRVETLNAAEWKLLRVICNIIGDKMLVPTALNKLHKLGALGHGNQWNFVSMSKEISTAIRLAIEEVRFMEKYVKDLNR